MKRRRNSVVLPMILRHRNQTFHDRRQPKGGSRKDDYEDDDISFEEIQSKLTSIEQTIAKKYSLNDIHQQILELETSKENDILIRRWKDIYAEYLDVLNNHECLQVIPNSFVACGEEYGDEFIFCSDQCQAIFMRKKT